MGQQSEMSRIKPPIRYAMETRVDKVGRGTNEKREHNLFMRRYRRSTRVGGRPDPLRRRFTDEADAREWSTPARFGGLRLRAAGTLNPTDFGLLSAQTEGVHCVAAPIRDSTGAVIAEISERLGKQV